MADSRASQAESNKERTATKQGEGELSHTEAMWVAAGDCYPICRNLKLARGAFLDSFTVPSLQ
jgi:hypothetical protein